MLSRKTLGTLALMAGLSAMVVAPDAMAFRMIQNNTVGFVSAGAQVPCNDAGGFTHWTIRQIIWRINTANNPGGVPGALDHALNQWNGVSGSDYDLSRGSSNSTGGFGTDGTNTILWANGNGCTGNCLALTGLTLTAGQVIVEADVTFNSNENWTTSNVNFDIRSVATHEIGHSLGIHHSDRNPLFARPTMRAGYRDGARTIENDDRDALRCSVNTFPINCTNPCPTGGVYDGANCYMWSVPGNEAFVYNGNFYYKPVWHPLGPCPNVVWDMVNNTSIQPWFDGANCYIGSAGGGPNPFFFDGNYYISASAGANPCPFGGTYDGANCYMYTWPGVDPFIFDENMYYEPVWHPNGPCPHPVVNNWLQISILPTFDSANCLVQAGPGGNQTPFIWSNNYYLTPVCNP